MQDRFHSQHMLVLRRTSWNATAGDGSVVWNFAVNARGHKNLWSSPALHDGRVYFGSYDGNVYCLNAVTGTEVWRSRKRIG